MFTHFDTIGERDRQTTNVQQQGPRVQHGSVQSRGKSTEKERTQTMTDKTMACVKLLSRVVFHRTLV